MNDCIWVLEVGGGLRSAHTDLLSAGIAFDNAYRPDASRELTCVAIDTDPPADADQPSQFEHKYAIKFRDGALCSVSLWSDYDVPQSVRYDSGYGWVILEAKGARAAIEAAIIVWGSLPELPDT